MEETPKHSKRKHSDFSASASHRWLNCPGSVRLAREAPPSIDSKYAREGTEAHECLEFLVRRYSNLESAALQAAKRWPKEMVDHGVTAARLIFGLRPRPAAKLLVETRVVLRQVSHRFFGTLDYAWVEDFGELTVIDYKYGAGVPVYACDEDGPNPQLMYYAAGIAHQFDYEFERINLVIIQPRVWQEGGDGLSMGHVTVGAIRKFEKRLKEAMALANRADAPLKAGDHCRWCPAAATCPETSQKALAKADIVFDLDAGVAAAPEPFAVTPKTIPKLLEACNQLETWIRAIRERAFHLAESGKEIPGYKLVAKRAQRVWQGDAELQAAKLFGPGIYNTDPEFLSPAKLEKKFGASAKAFTEKYTAAVSSGFSLVKDKDARPEIKTVSPFDHD